MKVNYKMVIYPEIILVSNSGEYTHSKLISYNSSTFIMRASLAVATVAFTMFTSAAPEKRASGSN